ncbi:MAG: hypothetical protein CM1200mP37_0370 [Chloroflexota bacterium]|nr:MAG: hypothetical protein CM1200mP37_0370 [Chloroflexota bacterium]
MGRCNNKKRTISQYIYFKKIYESHNIDINKEIITYCRLGHRASLTWYILKYILKSPNVRVYDGPGQNGVIV